MLGTKELHLKLHEYNIPHSDSDFQLIEVLKRNRFNFPDTIPYAVNPQTWRDSINIDGRLN